MSVYNFTSMFSESGLNNLLETRINRLFKVCKNVIFDVFETP